MPRQLCPTAPGQPAVGLGVCCWVLGRELLCNTSSHFLCAVQPCWSGGQQRGCWATAWPVQACSGVLGQGLGKPPGLRIRGQDRLSHLVSFFKPSFDLLPR